MGHGAQASGIDSIAIGTGNQVTGDHSGAFGDPNIVTGTGSYAFGNNNTIANNNTFVVGNNVITTQDSSVVLGDGSTDRAATSETGTLANPYAGSAPVGVVSVGSVGGERQVINVAAGAVNAASTDAINGSQLHATNEVLGQGLNFEDNQSVSVNKQMGDTLKIRGGMAAAAPSNAASSRNMRTTFNPITNDLVIQMSKNLIDLETVTVDDTITVGAAGDQTVINKGSVTADTINAGTANLTNVVSNSTTTAMLNAGGGTLNVGANTFAVGTGTNINMGNNKVKNVAAGDLNATSRQAVNGSQLFQTNLNLANLATQGLTFGADNGADVVRPLGSTVKITGAAGPGTHKNIDTTTNNDGMEIKLNNELRLTSSGSVKMGDTLVNNNGLTINGGPSMTKTNGIDAGNQKITGVLWGQNGRDAVNVNQLNAQNTLLTNKGLNFAGNKGPGFTTPLGETVNIRGGMTQMANNAASGANIRTVARANGVLAIQMSKDLVDLDTVTVGDNVADQTKIEKGTITTNTINADDVNTAALNVGGGALIANGTSFAISNGTSINMGNNQVAGVANGTSADHAVNLSQLDAVNATASAGWNIGSNGDPVVNVAPGADVDFSNTDNNIVIAQNGTDLEFDLNKDIKLKNGTLTISRDGDFPDSIKSLLGTDGLLISDQHESTLMTKTGITIEDVRDVGFATTQLTKNMLTVGGANPIVMNGTSGTITGLTNTDWSGADYGNSGRAATEAQVKPMSDFLGLDASQSYTFEYNGMQHASLAAALDSMHWNVSAPTATPGTPIAPGAPTSPTKIHNGDTVGFAGDNNISVGKTDNPNGTDISITLNKDIVVDTVTATTVTADDVVANNSVTVGDDPANQTVINKGDITATGTVTAATVNAANINATGTVSASEVAITNGPTINDTGIDMRGQQIRSLADGTARDHAVNLGQLNDVRDQLHSEVNGVRRDLHKVDRKLRAGVAAAMATAGLPQAYTPGKSMVAMGGGTWNGESGLALGVSKITDSGKWVIKASGNASTRGDYGGTVGAGFQW